MNNTSIIYDNVSEIIPMTSLVSYKRIYDYDTLKPLQCSRLGLVGKAEKLALICTSSIPTIRN